MRVKLIVLHCHKAETSFDFFITIKEREPTHWNRLAFPFQQNLALALPAAALLVTFVALLTTSLLTAALTTTLLTATLLAALLTTTLS
jgi:hypothetical protein